jgi:hypothetical protein
MNDNDPLGPAGRALHALLGSVNRRALATNNRALANMKRALQRRRSRSSSVSRTLNSAYAEALYPLRIAKCIVLFGYPLAVAVFLEQLWDYHILTLQMAVMIILAHTILAIIDFLEREIATIQLFSCRPGALVRELRKLK